jgi:hypothetical protein
MSSPNLLYFFLTTPATCFLGRLPTSFFVRRFFFCFFSFFSLSSLARRDAHASMKKSGFE